MVDIFVEKKSPAKPSFDIGVLFNRKDVTGELGLEIEVEGSHLPHEDDTPSPWLYKHDGSLRGEDNAEYVLAKPIMFDDLPKALDALWKAFDKMKSKLDDSNRTSVHVHLNCQRFHLNRLTSFMALYFIVEDLLTHWCGEHRVGNLFCLRAKDAPAIVTQIKRFIKNSDSLTQKYKPNLLSDHLHYSGLNAHALSTFGSLEVRTLRGVSDSKTILEWVGMLRRLYDLSSEFKDPRQIIERFSEMGPMAFFEEILGPSAAILRRDIPHSDQGVREAMFEGVRLAQDLCYCRNWAEYKDVTIKKDPFGRDTRKLANQMMEMVAPQGGPTTIAQILNEGPQAFIAEPEGHFHGGFHDEEAEEDHGF